MSNGQKSGCIGTLFKLGVFGFVGIVLIVAILARRDPNDATSKDDGPSMVKTDPNYGDTPEIADVSHMPTEESKPVIPGLVPTDVYLNLTNRGFELKKDFEFQPMFACTSQQAWGVMSCDVFCPDPNHVWVVDATIGSPEAWEDEALKNAKEFLPFIATLPYEGATPDEAKAWVHKHVGENISRDFGPVRIELLRGAGYGIKLSPVE